MNPDQMTLLNRRNLLLLAGAVAGPGLAPAAAEFDSETQDPWMDDPKKSFVNYVRLMGDTSGRLSPQWWRGGYLGVFEDRHPELLFRLESCEMKRCIRRSAHEYEFQYRIFTMFLDPDAVFAFLLPGEQFIPADFGQIALKRIIFHQRFIITRA